MKRWRGGGFTATLLITQEVIDATTPKQRTFVECVEDQILRIKKGWDDWFGVRVRQRMGFKVFYPKRRRRMAGK